MSSVAIIAVVVVVAIGGHIGMFLWVRGKMRQAGRDGAGDRDDAPPHR